MFQEDNGGYSMLRVLIITWFLTQLVVWVIVAIHLKALPDLPPLLVSLDSGMLAAKVWQKKIEQNVPITKE